MKAKANNKSHVSTRVNTEPKGCIMGKRTTTAYYILLERPNKEYPEMFVTSGNQIENRDSEYFCQQ